MSWSSLGLQTTLKISYSCMPNVKNAIDAHNKTQLRQPTTEPTKSCNCRDKPNCPLNGQCRSKGIIYQATVSTQEKYPDGTNKTNKSCQKPTIELAGRLGEKLNISPLDIGHK